MASRTAPTFTSIYDRLENGGNVQDDLDTMDTMEDMADYFGDADPTAFL